MRRFPRIGVPIGIALLLASCSGGTQGPAGPNPTTAPTATPTGGATATATATATAPATSTPSAHPTATATATATPTATPTAAAFTADDWPVFGHDAARSGTSNEVTGTHGAVTLTKLWQTGLGDVADSAPIVKGSTLFVTVNGGTTYGIATSNGAKLWTFTTSGPNITTSEPAYDVAANELYVGGVDGRVHRLDPSTGVEDKTGGFPVLVTLATQTEKDASPLNVANGFVYAQTSGYDGDGDPYVGHVVAIATATGQSHVFNTLCSAQTGLIQPQTCSAQRSGMWSRAGVVVDPDATLGGRIYVATGNGNFNANSGNYGDSVLALAPDAGSRIANFTPADAAQLDANDQDLGSSSPALLPRQSASTTPLLAVQGGKEGVLRLLDRTNLNGTNAVLQTINVGSGIFSAPAVSANPNGTTYVYLGMPSGVTAYKVVTQGGATQLAVAWTASASLGGEGTSPVVRDGVVYVAADNKLAAFDATTGAALGSNSALGGVHWNSPIVAHGVVYCTDQNGNLTAFSIARAGGAAIRRR